MIVKFFKGGRTFNGAKSAFKYLLNERAEQGTAKVYKGDPDLTLKIIKNIKNKWKFTSGVISFEENITDENILNEIIKEFEKTFFAGLNEDQYNISYILHTDKNRTELHFLAPRLELTSQKAYNPYYVKKDFTKKDLFQDYINARFNLSSPHKKEKQHLIAIQPNFKTKKSKFVEQINEYVVELIKNNFIENREDIVTYLKKIELEVKESKNYIAVKTAKMPKFVRLKGEIYAKDFGSFERIRTKQEKRDREHCRKDYKEYKERLNKYITRATEYNKTRYKKNEAEASRNIQKIGRTKRKRECKPTTFNNSYVYSNVYNNSVFTTNINTNTTKKDKNDRRIIEFSRRARERNKQINTTQADVRERKSKISSIIREVKQRESDIKQRESKISEPKVTISEIIRKIESRKPAVIGTKSKIIKTESAIKSIKDKISRLGDKIRQFVNNFLKEKEEIYTEDYTIGIG